MVEAAGGGGGGGGRGAIVDNLVEHGHPPRMGQFSRPIMSSALAVLLWSWRTKRAALLWTISILGMSFVWGSQTVLAHSRRGLTSELYSSLVSMAPVFRFRRRKARVMLAFAMVLLVCSSDLVSFVVVVVVVLFLFFQQTVDINS